MEWITILAAIGVGLMLLSVGYSFIAFQGISEFVPNKVEHILDKIALIIMIVGGVMAEFALIYTLIVEG